MDELGRVVIPKEMRRTMHLREGEELEIFAEEEGLLLKKYSAMSALGGIAQEYARVIEQLSGGTVFITDTDILLAAAGADAQDVIGATFSAQVAETLGKRRNVQMDNIAVVKDGKVFAHAMICPVVVHGDLFGGVILCSPSALDSRAQTVVQTACCLFERHIGD
jgi:AbrB family transcriptional regulator (stage V sporulation protein T)